MPPKRIVAGQHVSPELRERSRQLRREMTPAESRLWQRLRAGRLNGFHFRRQQVIDPYIVDFYCHRAGLVIEVDGEVHLDQLEYDRQRDIYLQSRGVRVLRFTNTEVNNTLETVLSVILQTCQTNTDDDSLG